MGSDPSRRLDEGKALLEAWAVIVDDRSASGDSLFALSLDVARYRTPGGVWDGGIEAQRAFDTDGDGVAESVVFTVSAGLCKYPRGVGLGNIVTDEVDWFVPFAGSPAQEPAFGDLDGDGSEDMVLGLSSPCNMAVVDDMVDTCSYVAAIDMSGTVLWRHKTGGPFTFCFADCADLDGDGVIEVVDWVGTRSAVVSDSDSFSFSIRSGPSGKLLARWANGSCVNDVIVVDVDGEAVLFVACADGFLRSFSFDGSALKEIGGVDAGASLGGVAAVDIDPIDYPALIAVAESGNVFAFDLHLHPLAADPGYSGDNWNCPAEPVVYPDGVRGVMVREYESALFFALQEAPLAIWPFIVLGLAFTVGGSACLPRVRRRSVASLRRWLIPRADRERSLDGLLDELKTAGHGKLAATRTLRRLREQLAMLSGIDHAPPQAFVERYREAVDNVAGIGLPRVASVFREAARIGVASKVVAALGRDVTSCRRMIDDLPSGLPDMERSVSLQTLLDEMMGALDVNLNALKLECRLELSSSAIGEIRRAAGVLRVDLNEHGVDLLVPVTSTVEGVRVFVTRGELSFVLENLLANAIAAVEGAEIRRIEISAAREDLQVVILVVDSGKGIPPDLHERIFDEGFSEREGGGHGLAASREMLVKRGGSLRVLRSAPGEGTTFELKLDVC
jgi:signal transduction histidine kinase